MSMPLDTILRTVARPTRYLGNEVNAIHKDLDRVEVRFLLAFPDLYDVGMSHVGFQLLYHLLNSREDVAAERVFAPWDDLENALRGQKLPLFSLETRRPLRAFDIIGFSLQYELSYTNVLAMLDLGRIPLRSAQRDESFPLVIAGGPCTFNPEPMADFFDALVIGEGEEVVVELIETFKQWRRTGRTRHQLLDTLATIAGVYVPSRFRVRSHATSRIETVDSSVPNSGKVKKRTISDLESLSYPTAFIVPFAPIVHDRINLEVARGCSRGCRFCQAGIIYRPVRERSQGTLEALAESAFAHTGWEELSFLSLSTGDYSHIEDLLTRLISRFSCHRVAFSLPSLRAETLRSALVRAVSQARKTGFTIAPEAGTERLRNVINKGLTETEILETCRQVFLAGWNTIKLYFMVGLPTETTEDLEAIVRLAEKVWDQGKAPRQKWHVTVSVSTFVPKPHTPFQWEPMIGLEEIRFRQRYLRSLLRGSRFTFKWQDPNTSVLEAVMARGDRRLSVVIEAAFRRGARFDGWSERFSFALWRDAFSATGINLTEYVRSYDESEVLPWDHIESGVTKEYLLRERRKAEAGVLTPDCRLDSCHHCGVCDHNTIYPRISSATGGCTSGDDMSPSFLPSPAGPIRRFRLRFSKRGPLTLLGHLELTKAFARAARRARLPLRYTQGFHPLPRMAFGPALPVGVESLAEYLDLDLVGDVTLEDLVANLNHELPQGLRIESGQEISLKTSAIADSILEVSYCLSWRDDPGSVAASPTAIYNAFCEFHKRNSFPVSRFRNQKVETIDLREVVKEISFSPAPLRVELTVRFPQARSLRPAEIVKSVLGLGDEALPEVHVIKTNTILRSAWAQISSSM